MADAIHPAETAPTTHMKAAVTLPLPQEALADVAQLPGSLLDWLVDLALLKPLPLSALVPDAAWLPPESLRFFHVDWRWTERLLDGALAAGNLGLQDEVLHRRVIADLRGQVVARLRELAGEPLQEGEVPLAAFPMTGMLLRSSLVRRWPRMAIRAYADAEGAHKVRLMRREQLSQSLVLVLFPGTPARVEIQEPYEGVQFGLEPSGDPVMVYSLTLREEDGTAPPGEGNVGAFVNELGRVELAETHQSVIAGLCAAHQRFVEVNSRGPALLSLNLQQLPYVQIYAR